jgi:hypothetical protein
MEPVVPLGTEIPKEGIGIAVDESSPATRRRSAFSGTRSEVGSLSPKWKDATVVQYGHSVFLPVPQGVPANSGGEGVLAVQIARNSEPRKDYELYTMSLVGRECVYLEMSQLDTKRDERFLIKSIGVYHIGRFIKEYNSSKVLVAEYGRLEKARDPERARDLLVLRRQRGEVQLWNSRLMAKHGQVVLQAGLRTWGQDHVQIAKGLNGFDCTIETCLPMFPVLDSADMHRLGHQDARYDADIHARIGKALRRASMRRESEGTLTHQLTLLKEGINLDKSIEMHRDSMIVEFSPENRRKAQEYLASASKCGAQSVHRGDIGEFVVGTLLEKSGFDVVDRHPDAHQTLHSMHASNLRGRDIVVKKYRENYVVEAKHQKHSERALSSARLDMEKFSWDPERQRLERQMKVDFKGALMINLEWSHELEKGIIQVDYLPFPLFS